MKAQLNLGGRIRVGSVFNRRARAVPEFRKVMRRRIILDGD
jgi:hypothetical protein